MVGVPTVSSGDRVVVVGSGLAGLAAALCLAPLPVLLITGGQLGYSGSSVQAQGGIACAIGRDDSPALHAADTLAAGGGLSDRNIVERVTNEAPWCIDLLRTWGVSFDVGADGEPMLTREGAHRRRRVLHAGGDRTGAVSIRALEARVRAAASVTVAERSSVVELLVKDGTVRGVLMQHGSSITAIGARAVVLATGGAAALYASTTNPSENWGSGLRLAARAGALLRDLEFVQFHPTAIDLHDAVRTGSALPLASEAIRGEGGILIDETGEPVMSGVPGGNLAPRDQVAQVLWRRLQAGRKVFLDTRDALGERFPHRFPAVAAHCRAAGVDPVTQPIPVRPAAHYHMGGVQTDANGATSVEGLWAIGEVASTGLHGANRLASNSLLEAVAFAGWAASDIRARERRGPLGLPSTSRAEVFPKSPVEQTDTPGAQQLRQLMDAHVGVERDRHGLETACEFLIALGTEDPPHSPTTAMSEVAFMIAQAALDRQESRGAHTRRDFPTSDAAWSRHQVVNINAVEHRLTSALVS